MADVSLSQRTSFRRSDLLLMAALLLGGEALGIAVSFATRTANPDLSKAFAAGAAALLFGALLGGIVSLLIAELDRRRVHRAATIEYITHVLADLKAVHDQVDRGRTLIAAHQSARTYGEELRGFIESRVKLLQVERALKFDDRGAPLAHIRPDVSRMEKYLRLLVQEFETSYKEISRAQVVYEARVKRASEAGEELPPNAPWEAIAELPHLREFLGTERGSAYRRRFIRPLDQASAKLRVELDAQFHSSPPRQPLQRKGRKEAPGPQRDLGPLPLRRPLRVEKEVR
jgi:hypothetical protein